MRKAILSGLLLIFSVLSYSTTVVDSLAVQNMCPGDPVYTTISDSIVVYEGATGDFTTGSRTRVLTVPAGFELNPGTGSVVFSKNFSATGFTITANTITYNYNLPGGANSDIDTIVIKGLQVRADTAAVSAGCLLVSDATGIQNGNDLGDAVCHAYFSVINLSASITPTNVTCNSGSNGSATVVVVGGVGPVYNWLPGNPTGDGTTTITGLSAGQYHVVVTSGSCVVTDTVTITEPSAVNVTINNALTDSVNCNGGSDGGATANNATGGTGGYSYLWSPSGSTNQVLTGVTAGVHSVVATDGSGCSSPSANVTIGQPAAISVTITDTTHVSFYGGADGNAKGSATGGNGAYNYNWTPGTPTGDGTDSIYNLTAGGYTLIVTDQYGCSNSAPVTITQPNAPLQPGTIGSNQQGCDSLDPVAFTNVAPATGDDGNFTYQWQSSTNLIAWTNVGPSGPAATTYNETWLYQTTYFRREVTSTFQGPVYTSPIVVTIDASPTVAFTGLDNQYCEYEALDTLNGIPNSPAGTFTGPPGVYDFGNGQGAIDPDSIGWGNHVITYTWTDPSTGCIGVFSQTAVVDSIPTLNPVAVFDSLQSNYFLTDPQDRAYPNPTGGYFAGPGMTGNFFDPSLAGVGVHRVVYHYTHPTNGCIDSTEMQITVVSSGTAIGGLGIAHCESEGVKRIWTINAPPANGGPSNVQRLGFFLNGSPLFPISSDLYTTGRDSGLLNIPAMAPGNYTVQYRYSEWTKICFPFIGCFYFPFPNTKIWDSQNLIIEAKPTSAIVGLQPLYCASGDTVFVNGSPGGGILSATPGGALFGNKFVPQTPGGYNFQYIFTSVGGVCVDTSYANTTVVGLPIVSMSGQDTAQCIYEATDTIVGLPTGGDFWSSAAGFVTSPIPAADTGYLDPSAAGAGTFKVAYTYMDANGCTNSDTQLVVINPRPIVSIAPFQNQICVKTDSIIITASPASGNWTNPGVKPFASDSASFWADSTLPGLNWVYYDYTDINGCFNIDSQSIQVDTLPVVNILNMPDTMCESSLPGDAISLLTNVGPGNFIGNNVVNGNTYFPFPTAIDSSVMYGLDTTVYVYTDVNGCVGYDTAVVRILPSPVAGFLVLNHCITDSIQFQDTSQFFNWDTIGNWNWDLDDNLSSTQQDPYVWYSQGNLGNGSKNLSLTVTSLFGCTNTFNVTDLFGLPSKAKFEWNTHCFGDSVTFTDSSSATGQIVRWNWDFGDLNIDSVQSPVHLYSDTGNYLVNLSVLTNRGCVDSLTRRLVIRPVINQYPYYIDNENGNGGWASFPVDENQSTTNTWELGVPASPVINSAASGAIAWVTNLTGDYSNDEASYVDGPCFDLSVLQKPMVKFNSLVHSQSAADGAVLQYSLDSGATWITLGDQTSGLEWYDETGLNGNPGNQGFPNYGWAGHSADSAWRSSRHKLDRIIGKTKVRFRIVFGSDAATADDGFAFDDFWIGERNKILLMEQFTNSSDNNSASVDSTIYRFQEENKLDMVDIHYHTSVGGVDPMNANNSIEPGARRTQYSVSNNGWSVLDGNYKNQASFLVSQKQIDHRVLEDNLFDVSTTTAINGGMLDIKTIVKANVNFANLDVSVHNVIVEDSVNITGTNGQTQWQGVLHKMMPNAAGTKMKTNWTVGDIDSVTVSWPISNVYNLTNDQLEVVAFIQNNSTLEVYQSVNDDTTTALVSVPEVAQENPMKFIVFPNPTHGQFTIALNQFILDGGVVRIFDQVGSLVREERIPYGRGEISLDLTDIAQGMYLVNVVGNNKKSETQRLMIIH